MGKTGWTLISAVALLALSLSSTGCSTVGSFLNPYEDDSPCADPWGGRCGDAMKAYNDSVDGRPVPKPIGRDADGNVIYAVPDEPLSPEQILMKGTEGLTPAELRYRQNLYNRMSGIVAEPQAPIITPPKTLRVLVMPYSDRQKAGVLYMERYIYVVVEDPKWLVGGQLVE